MKPKADWVTLGAIIAALAIWALGVEAVHRVSVLYDRVCVVSVPGDVCDQASSGVYWLSTLAWLSPFMAVAVAWFWRGAKNKSQIK